MRCVLCVYALCALCLAALAGAVAPCSAQVDEQRVREAVASYLGLDARAVAWPPIKAPEPPANWLHAISLELGDPPDRPRVAGAPGILLEVHPRDYYVKLAMWWARFPPEEPKCAQPLSLEACRGIAEGFARARTLPWPAGMRLAKEGPGVRGPANVYYRFSWEERDGDVRTGRTVSVGVSSCPPGPVCSFTQYLPPPHSLAEVKVTREEAVAAACKALATQGAQKPRATQTALYLSRWQLERPHWRLTMEYDNRHGGFLPGVCVDAATGEVVTPQW